MPHWESMVGQSSSIDRPSGPRLMLIIPTYTANLDCHELRVSSFTRCARSAN